MHVIKCYAIYFSIVQHTYNMMQYQMCQNTLRLFINYCWIVEKILTVRAEIAFLHAKILLKDRKSYEILNIKYESYNNKSDEESTQTVN